MKKICALILLTTLLSCKSSTKQSVKIPTPDTTQQLINKLLPVYQGVWVKSDYLDKVRKTKSVLASVDLVTGITAIRINPALLTGDSIKANISWDNHTDGVGVLKFENGKFPSTIKFKEFDLGYAIQNNDTSLISYKIYNNMLFKTAYHKILPIRQDENITYALSYAINKVLISGDYNLINTSGKIEKVTFTNNGQVVGLTGFKKYLIETDMKYGPMENMDQMTFDVYTNNQQTFAYVFNGDKLELYETKPNAEQTLLIRGKLKYRLVRTGN